jgi:hypothetical protein
MTQDTFTDTGIPDIEDVQYEDYWGVNETFKFMLPDGKQFFEVRPLDEGGKSRFQKKTNKGLRLNQRTQDAHIDVDPSDERHTLIKESVVSFFIMQKDPITGAFSQLPCPPDPESRPFKQALDSILTKFNPKAIQDLEFFIRTKNPWLQADMTIEQIEEEEDRLAQLKKQVKERLAGEADSANK